MPVDDDILDPAHLPDNGTNVGAAGLARPEPKVEDKISADGNILERDGRKYIDYNALQGERSARQKAEAALAELDPLIPEFNEFLTTRNNRQAAQRQAVVAPGDEKDEEGYLQEVAVALGLYDETHQPDLRRAQAHLNITRKEATRSAQREVRPVSEASVKERARANRERVRGAQFVDGQPIADQKYLDAAHNALPEEYLADPQVAALTQVIAAGLQSLDERKNGVARRGAPRRNANGEPMFVERGTGRYDGDGGTDVSALDAAAARARGKTTEQWAKMSKQVNSSRAALDEVS